MCALTELLNFRALISTVSNVCLRRVLINRVEIKKISVTLYQMMIEIFNVNFLWKYNYFGLKN